jgi:hypothetical protein
VRVTNKDGKTTTLYPDGDSAMVAVDDPVLGPNGTVEGAALLRDFPRVAQALRETPVGDLWRGVVLGQDGVALVGAEGVRLIPPGDPWTQRVVRASTFDPTGLPLLKIAGDDLLHQAEPPLDRVPGTTREGTLGEFAQRYPVLLLHENLRATLSLEDGPIAADALPFDLDVVVVEAVPTREQYQSDAASQPDVLLHGGKWSLVVSGALAAAGSQPSEGASPTPTPTASVPGNGGSEPSNVHFLLVCQEDDEELCAA